MKTSCVSHNWLQDLYRTNFDEFTKWATIDQLEIATRDLMAEPNRWLKCLVDHFKHNKREEALARVEDSLRYVGVYHKLKGMDPGDNRNKEACRIWNR